MDNQELSLSQKFIKYIVFFIIGVVGTILIKCSFPELSAGYNSDCFLFVLGITLLIISLCGIMFGDTKKSFEFRTNRFIQLLIAAGIFSIIPFAFFLVIALPKSNLINGLIIFSTFHLAWFGTWVLGSPKKKKVNYDERGKK